MIILNEVVTLLYQFEEPIGIRVPIAVGIGTLFYV